MTPEQHAKAIEDAARKVTQASIDYMVDSGLAYKLGRAESALQAAIRAGVGAALEEYDHGPQAGTIAEAVCDVSKWLNERPNRPLDLRSVAMLSHSAEAQAAPDVVAELEEVKTVCAEAYQVVGVLLADAGRFDSPEGQKILDNLSEQRLRHTDVLPWASKAVPLAWRLVKCWCEDCDVAANVLRSRMSVCPECGDKRCARAKNHSNGCSAAAPKP